MPIEDELSAISGHSHDGFFKSVFSQPAHARAFFQSQLPAAIVESVDWSTLAVLPGSFVGTALEQRHSDLLFSVQLESAAQPERELLLYLLFEHQSRPDPLLLLRLLGYIVAILRRHEKQHGLPLPPVLPFVFHQGAEKWNCPITFEALFDLPHDLKDGLLPFLPKFEHLLLDLTQVDPATEVNDTRLRAVLQLMKLARNKELLSFFRWLAGLSIHDIPDDLLSLMLLYALHSDSGLDVETIYHSLSANPELEKTAMSVAEKLIAKGIVQGREEGREEGLWIGKIQAFEEFLDVTPTLCKDLEALTLVELQHRHSELRCKYESRFKQR